MIRKLTNEFTKLRYSRILYFIVTSTILMPVSVLMLVVILNSDIRYDSVTYLEYMAMILKALISLVAITIYNWVAADLVAREFKMDTIKSQLTIPIERGSFIFTKLLFISLILMIMTLSVFLIATFISIGMSMKGFTLTTAGDLLIVFLKSGLLMLPYAYFTVFLVLVHKNTLIPMVINIILLLIASAIGGTEISTIFPWAAPYHIIFMNDLIFSLQKSYISIYLLGIISMYLCNLKINKMEI
ncbi:hypothetical protein EZV73_04335 [Acidaminobacter sp. JC074]|uniref:ABC transporter permease n=1 Tax=Acidaminobacter sp. JC074 TaxID=2530199 RepID=UPI001F10B090|nr:ABC transporter permease [Acidaminobacter sp. JC074]MCH4886781.1 hypothetical protein [Acidaminobacter sp. JC074]